MVNMLVSLQRVTVQNIVHQTGWAFPKSESVQWQYRQGSSYCRDGSGKYTNLNHYSLYELIFIRLSSRSTPIQRELRWAKCHTMRVDGFDKIIRLRQKPSTRVRKFNLPDINYTANSYVSMIDWSKEKIYEPPCIRMMTTN